jgi:hypothetical protein
MKDLEEKYKLGIAFLKERGYYKQIVDEVFFLIKYIHPQMFVRLLSENLFNDMRGVFGAFAREDLRKIYQELQVETKFSVKEYLDKKYMNLIILHKCATNLDYQVKSIARMPEVKKLKLKSRFIETVSRKVNGEIQIYYRFLTDKYKKYFRLKFTQNPAKNDLISIHCIEKLALEYDDHFLTVSNRFQQLSMAINFVKDLFKTEIDSKIVNQLAPIFDQQEKFNKLVDYFINDLKRNFIHALIKHQKNGRSYKWIREGMETFIEGERFGALLQKVIYQTLSIMQHNRAYQRVS